VHDRPRGLPSGALLNINLVGSRIYSLADMIAELAQGLATISYLRLCL
jgi:hypothetical protein